MVIIAVIYLLGWSIIDDLASGISSSLLSLLKC